jgi:hypothetical protein
MDSPFGFACRKTKNWRDYRMTKAMLPAHCALTIGKATVKLTWQQPASLSEIQVSSKVQRRIAILRDLDEGEYEVDE